MFTRIPSSTRDLYPPLSIYETLEPASEHITLEALKPHVYPATDIAADDVCPTCTLDYEDEPCTKTTRKHSFHLSCLAEWMKAQKQGGNPDVVLTATKSVTLPRKQ